MSLTLGAFALGAAGAASAASAASSLFGGLKSLGHSSVQKATWGDYRKQAYFDELAEGRALRNAKDLFSFQQSMAPGMTMQGYRNAGLNPILAGDYNGAMPSAPTPSQSPAPKEYVNNASAMVQAGSALSNLAETMSRVNLNEANAKAIQERSRMEQDMHEGAKALQAADLAYKKELPAEVRKRVERMTGQILVDEVERDLLRSNISLNSAKMFNLHSNLALGWSKLQEDKDYHKKYLEKLSSYIGLPFGLGRLTAHDAETLINRLNDNWSEIMNSKNVNPPSLSLPDLASPEGEKPVKGKGFWQSLIEYMGRYSSAMPY